MQPGFIPASWNLPDTVVAGTTTRQGGASGGVFSSLNMGAHVGDDEARVVDNRDRVRAQLGLRTDPAWLKQVHGTTVVEAHYDRTPPEADASWTSRPLRACVVMTADCLPVLFAAGDGRHVAAAHAGWRGLAAGILEATVSAMNVEPDDLHAWFGPAISQAAFEVGDEVRSAFLRADPAAEIHFKANPRRRWQANLYGLARQRLEAIGVSQISGGDRCTYGEPDAFYSYRRDGQSGRMATLIFRRESPGNP